MDPIQKTTCRNIFESAAKNDLESIKHFVEDENIRVTAKNEDEQTAAHIAARNRNLTILQYLVSKDRDVLSVVDKWDQSVLHQAVKVGALDMVKYLVDECKTNPLSPKGRIFGDTCVHIAALEGQLDVLKYLLEVKKHSPNIRNTLGESPMFMAAESMHLEVVKYLCEKHNADPTQVDNNQKNILFVCARKGNLEIPKYLLDERKVRIDINWRDVFGETIIFVGARYDKLKCIKYFVEEKNADFNIPTKLGQTPLHEAANEGYLEIVQYLCEKGAKVDVKNKEGDTPRKIAKRKEVKEYLDSIATPSSSSSSSSSSPSSSSSSPSSSLSSLSSTPSPLVPPPTPPSSSRRRRSVDCGLVQPSWIHNTIVSNSHSTNRIGESMAFHQVNSFQIQNLFVFANAYVRHFKSSTYRKGKHELFSSAVEVLKHKMDPNAIEAVNEYK